MKDKIKYGKVKVPQDILSAIDAVKGILGFRTRAEFITFAIRSALKSHATLLHELNALKHLQTHSLTQPQQGD